MVIEAPHGTSLIITNERIRRWINSNESLSGRRDGSHQRRGVDLIGHGGLCQIDDCEKQELRVVEDRETLHLGGGKGEQHDLGDGDRPHEQHLGGIVHAWGGHFDLLRHGHDGGGNQQDFDPRKLVSADIEEYCSRIREEELPEDEQRQNVHETRYQAKKMTFTVPSSVRVADDCGVHVSRICHWHISRLRPAKHTTTVAILCSYWSPG